MICKLNASTGETILYKTMDRKYFAEGMQVYGEAGDEKLIQITWKSRTGFIYDVSNLELIQTFQFTTTKIKDGGFVLTSSRMSSLLAMDLRIYIFGTLKLWRRSASYTLLDTGMEGLR